MRQRFRVECETLHQLNHEVMKQIFANDVHDGYPFLVMEKAPGERLGTGFSKLLATGGWEAVLKMAAQLAAGLDAVHAEGLIHRDLKPDNIMVDPRTGKAMVVDFGIARQEDSNLTGNSLIGTLGFCSPEQCRAQPTPASDQWSFAACFYSLLTGLRPGLRPGEAERLSADERRAQVLESIMGDELLSLVDAPTLVKVPEVVAQAVSRAMSFDPEDRFPTLVAFVEAMACDFVAEAPEDGPSTDTALEQWMRAPVAPVTETPILLSPKVSERGEGSLAVTTRDAERVTAALALMPTERQGRAIDNVSQGVAEETYLPTENVRLPVPVRRWGGGSQLR